MGLVMWGGQSRGSEVLAQRAQTCPKVVGNARCGVVCVCGWGVYVCGAVCGVVCVYSVWWAML